MCKLYNAVSIASFPLKTQKIRKMRREWITKGIRVSSKHERELYIHCRNSNNQQIIGHYNKYCKILAKTIKEFKWQYYNEQIINLDNKIKTFGM
jgi:hypothetical protein